MSPLSPDTQLAPLATLASRIEATTKGTAIDRARASPTTAPKMRTVRSGRGRGRAPSFTASRVPDYSPNARTDRPQLSIGDTRSGSADCPIPRPLVEHRSAVLADRSGRVDADASRGHDVRDLPTGPRFEVHLHFDTSRSSVRPMAERTAVNPWFWSVNFGFNQGELVEGATARCTARGRPQSTRTARPNTSATWLDRSLSQPTTSTRCCAQRT